MVRSISKFASFAICLPLSGKLVPHRVPEALVDLRVSIDAEDLNYCEHLVSGSLQDHASGPYPGVRTVIKSVRYVHDDKMGRRGTIPRCRIRVCNQFGTVKDAR